MKNYYLENGLLGGQRTYLVYFVDNEYRAVDAIGLGAHIAELKLPTPTPNYVRQAARSPKEAIDIVKDKRVLELLVNPI